MHPNVKSSVPQCKRQHRVHPTSADWRSLYVQQTADNKTTRGTVPGYM